MYISPHTLSVKTQAVKCDMHEFMHSVHWVFIYSNEAPLLLYNLEELAKISTL